MTCDGLDHSFMRGAIQALIFTLLALPVIVISQQTIAR